MGFNKAQIQAIHHYTGPALVLAGPGSGKTTVITHRTKHLIEAYGVKPSEILVITFTKMAAGEMKQRFLGLMGERGAKGVTFGTFHAVFFTILKAAYHYTPQNIIREEKQREIIRHCMSRYPMEVEDENERISDILGEISTVKSQRMNPETYYSMSCPQEIFREVYRVYDMSLKQNRLIDFDDMLVYCYELLEARADILQAWQKKYRFILVDEFQDINRIQYEVIRLLAGGDANLFIVGDDDQSIYGFRGAKPEIMLNFKKDYPNAKEILLNYNYRSTDVIIEGAGRVIAHNGKRFPKAIKGTGKQGNPVVIREFPDMEAENGYILEELKRLHEKEGISYADMAVLARTNVGVRPVMGKLIEYNIPFSIREKIPNLYEHWIAQDLFAYVRLGMGGRQRGDFLRVMNKPKRYISRDLLQGQEIQFSTLLAMTGERYWLYDKIQNFRQDLEYLGKMNPYAAINYIRRGIGYNEYLQKYAKERQIREEELMNILGEIQESARNFNTYPEWFGYIESYGEKLLQQAHSLQEKQEAVSLCTMHSSKGLEYGTVFIADANEGVMPYHKAVLEEAVEEERRMFYVAVTRARERLYICAARERFNKVCEISRFAEEWNGKLCEKIVSNRENRLKFQ